MGVNEMMGLPVGQMEEITIAFDVDGTLRNNTITDRVVPNEEIRTLLYLMRKFFKNTRIVVWSGSGELYARQCANEMGITHLVHEFWSKSDHAVVQPHIAIDDIQDTGIGDINLIVRCK